MLASPDRKNAGTYDLRAVGGQIEAEANYRGRGGRQRNPEGGQDKEQIKELHDRRGTAQYLDIGDDKTPYPNVRCETQKSHDEGKKNGKNGSDQSDLERNRSPLEKLRQHVQGQNLVEIQ